MNDAITIACSGPSLPNHGISWADICVNLAINTVRCYWLCANDQYELHADPLVGVVTRAENMAFWGCKYPDLEIVNALVYEQSIYFSIESAIYFATALAQRKKIGIVRIYGMDMAGGDYYDGSPMFTDSTRMGVYFAKQTVEQTVQERWKLERFAVSVAMDRARNNGVHCERMSA